jgi:hypothetical protein
VGARLTVRVVDCPPTRLMDCVAVVKSVLVMVAVYWPIGADMLKAPEASVVAVKALMDGSAEMLTAAPLTAAFVRLLLTFPEKTPLLVPGAPVLPAGPAGPVQPVSTYAAATAETAMAARSTRSRVPPHLHIC